MCVAKEKHDYFEWLCSRVGVDTDSTSYWLLARDLFSKEFYSLIEHDENRSYDGLALREEYGSIYDEDEETFMDTDCTVLEMLIALAERMSDELYNPETGYKDAPGLFWELIDNLGLSVYSDDIYVEIDGTYNCGMIIDCFLNREYAYNGEGGLFPLKNPLGDQREVEIWYQMHEYMKEKY